MKRAYDVRSDILHGNEMSNVPKAADGSPQTLNGFFLEVEEAMRRALTMVLDVAPEKTPDEPLVDWDGLVPQDGKDSAWARRSDGP